MLVDITVNFGWRRKISIFDIWSLSTANEYLMSCNYRYIFPPVSICSCIYASYIQMYICVYTPHRIHNAIPILLWQHSHDNLKLATSIFIYSSSCCRIYVAKSTTIHMVPPCEILKDFWAYIFFLFSALLYAYFNAAHVFFSLPLINMRKATAHKKMSQRFFFIFSIFLTFRKKAIFVELQFLFLLKLRLFSKIYIFIKMGR